MTSDYTILGLVISHLSLVTNYMCIALLPVASKQASFTASL